MPGDSFKSDPWDFIGNITKDKTVYGLEDDEAGFFETNYVAYHIPAEDENDSDASYYSVVLDVEQQPGDHLDNGGNYNNWETYAKQDWKNSDYLVQELEGKPDKDVKQDYEDFFTFSVSKQGGEVGVDPSAPYIGQDNQSQKDDTVETRWYYPGYTWCANARCSPVDLGNVGVNVSDDFLWDDEVNFCPASSYGTFQYMSGHVADKRTANMSFDPTRQELENS